MNYIPPLDILTFQISQDATWYYVSFDLVGGDFNDALNINYGIELDTDHDGYGDFLVWASRPTRRNGLQKRFWSTRIRITIRAVHRLRSPMPSTLGTDTTS